jgi:hypothetical protein
VAVDSGGSDGVVPVAVHDNDNKMASAAGASSTNVGGGNGGRQHQLRSAVVDAAATILSLLWMAAAKTPLLPLPLTVAAVYNYCRR